MAAAGKVGCCHHCLQAQMQSFMYIARFLSIGLQLRHGRQVYCVNHENYIPGKSVYIQQLCAILSLLADVATCISFTATNIHLGEVAYNTSIHSALLSFLTPIIKVSYPINRNNFYIDIASYSHLRVFAVRKQLLLLCWLSLHIAIILYLLSHKPKLVCSMKFIMQLTS